MLELAALYQKANIKKLYKKVKKSSKGMRQLMIYNRNQNMADRLADFAAQHAICAAVGAGHLSGKRGVLNLLKQKGFELKPI